MKGRTVLVASLVLNRVLLVRLLWLGHRRDHRLTGLEGLNPFLGLLQFGR